MKYIYFIGDLNNYTRTHQRHDTLSSLGFEIIGISTIPIPWKAGINKPSLLFRMFWKFGLPLDFGGANKKIQSLLKEKIPDIVWIEQGVTIKPWTLKAIKRAAPFAKIISIGEDDMYARHNRSFYYDFGLKYYDAVFTTKTYNLEELKSLGAKRTELFLDSYNEDVHKPMDLSNEELARFTCDVSAIGAFEKERAESLLYLAEHGIKVAVWGGGWKDFADCHKNLDIKNEFLFGTDYSKAICGTKINLCFLRKINRDEVTSRSVEIPACEGFLLGERTKRHLEFFEEGKEAEFFDSDGEMLEKVKYYLTHEEERKRIAVAGRARCLSSGYSMKAQLEGIIEKIGQLKQGDMS